LSTILCYNKGQVKSGGSLEDIERGYNVWVDVVDPNNNELDKLANKFDLNEEAVKTCINKSKRPEIRQLDNHIFTVMVDMKNKDPEILIVEAIYLFLGKNRLITLHSSEINLKTNCRQII